MAISYSDSERKRLRRAADSARGRERGFTIPELLVALVVASILTAVAMPMYTSAMANMRMNATVQATAGAISRTRYQSVMTSQTYTLVITTPANTYTVTNTTTGNVFATSVPLPNPGIAINGGSAGTLTFTFSPNGTVSGAGGAAIPALALTYQGRETDITVSGVGNVTTKVVK